MSSYRLDPWIQQLRTFGKVNLNLYIRYVTARYLEFGITRHLESFLNDKSCLHDEQDEWALRRGTLSLLYDLFNEPEWRCRSQLVRTFSTT